MHVYVGSTHQRAERSGISRKTIFSIEKGSTSLGEYLNALKAFGFKKNILKLAKDDENLEYLDQTTQLQQEVADSYFVWWESHKDKDFSEFDVIDPLADTEYRWH